MTSSCAASASVDNARNWVRPHQATAVFLSLDRRGLFGLVQRGVQPDARVAPIPLRGGGGDAECFRRLGNRQAGEKAELDQLRLAWLFAGELGEGLVQGQQVFGRVRDGDG